MGKQVDKVGWAYLGREALLELLGLSVSFARAVGDDLHWVDESGAARIATDFVGGFGSTLLGHNHPKIRDVVERHLAEQRPTLVQASRRPPSDELRRTLATLLEAQTGTAYEVLLYSTGTEAVEAALKHARLEFVQRQLDARAEIESRLRELRRRLQRSNYELTDDFFRSAERTLRIAPIEDLAALEAALTVANLEALAHPGHLLAVEGGFHGKTMGSLAVTWNPDARQPFVRGPSLVRFVRDGDRMAEIHDELTADLYELVLDPTPTISSRRFGRICAVIAEPIRGEGGVQELEGAIADELVCFRESHPEIPLLIDEVQTGLGRTGCLLEGARRELPADYITLGKSLGGGLVKVSALAVDARRYRSEYSLLHTSTFADDDLSSAVALRALEVIDEENLQQKAQESGGALKRELNFVRERWPEQIADVRGRGLMLGIEFKSQDENPSHTLRVLAEENILTMIISGHLLHERDIRVLPTVGRRSVLRFQPSAYIRPDAIARVRHALDGVCAALAGGDAHYLLRYLTCPGRPLVDEPPRPLTRRRREPLETMRSRVAFVAHAIDAQTLPRWDPTLAGFSAGELERLMRRLSGTLGPNVVGRYAVRSDCGAAAELALIVIFMTAKDIERDLHENSGRKIRAQVFAAYERARELGCSLVGFGGYTSIATANCVEFAEDEPAVTTGNALTVAASHEAVRRTARELGIELERSTVAIFGATGNIGSVHARLVAPDCESLLLVGRPGSKLRLEAVAAEVAAELAMLYGRGLRGTTGLFGRFTAAYERIDRPPPAFPRLLPLIESALGNPLVATEEDARALLAADVIISASNSAEPVIEPRHVAQHRPVLLCDVAVPADVSREVAAQRPNAKVIFGGLVAVPGDRDFELPGFPLPAGETFACAAETLVLGLGGVAADFSRGPITTDQVREITALAKLHGFGLGSYKLDRMF